MAALPPGYVALRVDDADAICLESCVDAVREALGAGTLHTWASARPERRPLHGRDVAWSVTLPDGATHVVVRHSRHGGALAPLTGDRFLAPTRAPHELATSAALRAAGVRTPEVVAIATYPAGPLLRRADVATRLVPASRDLAAAIGAGDAWLDAVTELLGTLAAAGVRHPDLNLKNVLLAPEGAWLLDVDVVTFGVAPEEAARRNAARLARSLRKWQRLHALPVVDEDIAALHAAR